MKKKRLFLLIFCFILFENSYSQYSPFVVDSAVWIIKADDYVATPWVDSYYGYYMNGDTADGGFAYKKVFKLYFEDEAPSWVLPFQVDSMKLWGLARESSKKIYVKQFSGSNNCSLNSDLLLFDFNYIVGDTVNLCVDSELIDIISSIGTNVTYSRKNFMTDKSHEYIEGVGSNFGFFENVFTNVSGGYDYSLFSYCQGHITDCNLITDLNSNLLPVQLEIRTFPNPATDIININIPLEYRNSKLNVYDIYGKKCQEVFLKSGDNILSVDIPSGIYFFQYLNNNSTIFSQKICIK